MPYPGIQPPLQVSAFDDKASRKTLIHIAIAPIIIIILVLLNLELIEGIYFRNQITSTGFVINGVILLLFIIGMSRIVFTLKYYGHEENALRVFINNTHNDTDDLVDKVPKNSLIHRRYDALATLGQQRTPINHNALAAALLALESTRISAPKFINNILILTGVFGTIVSLSIALLGASNLLTDTADLGGMSLVMHGMSTALSTTITAIVCYLIFGYFYLKLTDVQTSVLGAIEEITSLHLLPLFQISTENLVQELGGLVRALSKIATDMHKALQHQGDLEERIIELIDNQTIHLNVVNKNLDDIREILREGFRLPELSRNL